MRHLKFYTRWTILGILIGVISSFGAILFFILLDFSTVFLLGFVGGYFPPTPFGEATLFVYHDISIISWRIPITLTIAGFISGIIVYTYAPETEGHGTDAYISAFHEKLGYIRGRVPIVKTAASALIIGSGGSAGSEGPIIQIGAGFGSWCVNKLKLSDKDRRIAIICGAAGGLGAIFKSPLGGALFAIEVLYKRDLESDALLPAFISSSVSYIIFGLFFGYTPIFETPAFVFNVSYIFLYLILGLICAIIAILYIFIFYTVQYKFFKKINIPNYYKPAIGGFMVGIIALFLPQILGVGFGWIQKDIFSELTLSLILILIFAKIIATSLTIGSGGSGGVFAPTLFIGAMIGAAFASIAENLFPTFPGEFSALVVIGMVSFITASSKVLIAPIIMISEITGNYYLMAPAMIACTISYIFSRKWTIYESQVLTKAQSPVHRGKFISDILDTISVKDVMVKNVITMKPDDNLKRYSELIMTTNHMRFPIVENNNLVGFISYKDILKVPTDSLPNTLVETVMTKDVITTTPNENLSEALLKIELHDHGHLPVVDPKDNKTLLGIISKQDIIRGHNLTRTKLFENGKKKSMN